MRSQQEQQNEETDFWRGWSDQCHSHHYPPQRIREMWRKYFHEFFGKTPEDHWFFCGRRFKGWHDTSEPGMFNPFIGLMLAKGGGLLPLLVLYLLENQPHYGNEIMKEIQERTRGRWVSNPGVIYPMLGFMEERGLLRGEWEDQTRRTRRFYSITKRGSEELIRLKDVMKPRLMEASDILQSLLAEIYATEESRRDK